MTAKRGTPQGDRLDVLATLVDAYPMAMAWKLHRGLGIPAESLIKQAA